ncbi:hypothetical protein CWE12_07530 [Aliidiomarina sedimenti]|uniref:DUF432 domain-containing protein n=1 Tax=Aliidiomarina sedimenti TaxID=1933879 RepID=A0ABY0BYP8_9GAMM|nr:hypothetical protein [Aliidiomarina sedimenti]RUO29815.1 hypothetical protein CWE12_07530 [Aliidiomarina sedimenti]
MLQAVEAFQLPPGEAVSIETHEETLFIQRQPQQWVLARVNREAPACSLQRALCIERNVTMPDQANTWQRWSNAEQESTLRIVPCMADKNLVARPTQPILIPHGRKPYFYVSLPLMYQLYIGNNKRPLIEFFVEKLPLTWFGSNTRRGELCYEIESGLVQSIDELPAAPHRAILEVRVHNRDPEHLSIDKLNLPAQFLPVYRVDGQHYWTCPLTITNEKLTDELSLHYGKSVPCRHEQLQLISEPRMRSEARTILRALEAIIG